MNARGDFDSNLQMIVEPTREPDLGRLRFLRWLAERGCLEHAPVGPPSGAYATPSERWLELARQALSTEACRAAGATGLAMPLDEAIEYAPASDAPATGEPAQEVSPSSRAESGLTPRELEVAALIARGLTNRQIAAELVMTEWAAANHVKHILARLGLDSRVQIAAWANEHGLHRRSPA